MVEQFSESYPKTSRPYGIFVTIENNGELRGCIGEFEPTNDVGKLIAKQTLESAFLDSRFFNNMITAAELSQLSYKVNFLNKPKLVFPNKYNDTPLQATIRAGYKIGKKKGHGIIVTFKERGRATYLASVLPDLGFTKLNEETWEKLIRSLRDKTNGIGHVSEVNIYYCQEFEENDKLKLDDLTTQSGGDIYEYKYKKYKAKYLSLKNNN